MKRELTKDEIASLTHALHHLESNKIADPYAVGGWYYGNRSHFIARHKKAIAFIRSLLKADHKEADNDAS